MSIPSAVINFEATVTEILAASGGAVGVRAGTKLTHSELNVSVALSDSSTPPVTIDSEQALTGAASGTIDLTALPTVSGNVSGSAKKVRCLRVYNSGPGNFVIGTGAANGYVMETRTIGPGETAMQYFNDRLGAIDGTHKNLDWTANAAATADVTLLVG